MRTKDGKNVTVDKLTADNYAVPAGEELLYHCVIEVVQYDPKTGVKISKPRVQKFGKKTFETFVQTLRKQGYTVNILHNPAGYAEALAKKKAEAEKAKFDAAVAKAVEAALAKKAEAEAAASAESAEIPVKEAKKSSKTAKKTKTEE